MVTKLFFVEQIQADMYTKFQFKRVYEHCRKRYRLFLEINMKTQKSQNVHQSGYACEIALAWDMRNSAGIRFFGEKKNTMKCCYLHI